MTVQASNSEGGSDGNVRIRMAAPADAALIASLLYESFAEYRDSYTPEAFAATTPTYEEVQSRMRAGPVWVALFGGTLVGTVAAVQRGRELYVRGMAVLT